MKLSELTNGLCAVIAEKGVKQLITLSNQALSLGADLVELRLDLLEEEFSIPDILRSISGPKLVTIRRKSDGGSWIQDEQTRINFLLQAQQFGAQAIDVESDCFHHFQASDLCLRILSFHHFAETPNNINALHKQFESLQPDLVKIACLANKNSDVVRILGLYDQAKIPLIAFCMGSIGFPSRILSLTKKSPWMYANFSLEMVNAPGIPTLNDVRAIYDLKNLSTQTDIFGVVGDPIGHSMSPVIHNACYQFLGYNGVYLPFHVATADFEAALKGYECLPVKGYSVTIPHKEKAFQFASSCSSLVKEIGAANTLVKTKDGFYAENTDATGILAALENRLGNTLLGRKVLILGAGGVSRAAVFALKKAGCIVHITNHNRDRAEKLALEAKVICLDWNNRHNFNSGLLLNCTPVGMDPLVNETPWDSNSFSKDHIVFDTVYNPIETRFLMEAKKAQAITIDGLEMFVCQAAEQFKLFTSLSASLDVMRNTAMKKLRKTEV